MKSPFPCSVNASRGPKKSQAKKEDRSYALNDYAGSEIGRASERHRLKRINERDELEEGLAPNPDYLQVLDEKEHVLEVQAVILRKLAAEENGIKGLLKDCEFDLKTDLYTDLMQEVMEALSMLKY